MTSKIKVDNINKVSDDSSIIKKCSSTTTVGSGAGNTIVVDGSTVTLGRCSGTVALASGATQTGFGRTGTVDWEPTPQAGSFGAANGKGYFVDTSAAERTVTLPASPSAGDIVAVADYTRTFNTNNCIIDGGSEKIGGVTGDLNLNVDGQSATFVYVDAAEGWINVYETQTSQTGRVITPYVAATGGCITTSGDYKIHTFNGTGPFNVTNEGTPGGSNTVDYLIVAGGGAGIPTRGGGAGGYRESSGAASGCYSVSPLGSGVAALPVGFQDYTITVGGGGSAPSPAPNQDPSPGCVSTFSTITSAGGGGNAAGGSGASGTIGGSNPGYAGNTPPVSPPQGNSGGCGTSHQPGYYGGGGGGAGAVGGNASPGGAGTGGAGATSCITASPVTRAGGGGGAGWQGQGGGSGGPGGGGNGAPSPSTSGGTNTGGAGGAGGSTGCSSGCARQSGAGGSGVVIIRYKYQ